MNDNNYVVILTGGKRVEVSADFVSLEKSGDLEFCNWLAGDSEEDDSSIDEVFGVARGQWLMYYKNDKTRNCPTNVEGL